MKDFAPILLALCLAAFTQCGLGIWMQECQMGALSGLSLPWFVMGKKVVAN